MARQIVTFERFDGGEYGLLGEREAPRGAWTGTNVVRYLDGSLGPRSGLIDITPASPSSGTFRGFGHNPISGHVWYIVAADVRQFPDAGPGQTATSKLALAGTPTNRCGRVSEPNGYETLIASLDDKGYLIDHTGGGSAAVAAHPGGRVSVILGDRAFTGGVSANPERLYYSAPADIGTWPVGNYIDVGYGGTIIGLFPANNRLVIAKTDGTWWLLSGTPGFNDVLRQIMRAQPPSSEGFAGPTRARVGGDGRVWFLPEYGDFPAYFNGVTQQRLDHLSLTGGGEAFPDLNYPAPQLGITPLAKATDLLITTGGAGGTAYDSQGLLLHNGVWSKHTFGKVISGWIDGHGDAQSRVFLSDGGSNPKFYAWKYEMARVPFSGRTFESSTDAGAYFTSSFTLPTAWHSAEGERLLSAVVVEFRKFAHGLGGNNGFIVNVTPMRFDGGAGTVQTGTFSESATVPTGGVAGQDTTMTLAFSDDTATCEGVRVQITNLVGCAIQRIHVYLDDLPLRNLGSNA